MVSCLDKGPSLGEPFLLLPSTVQSLSGVEEAALWGALPAPPSHTTSLSFRLPPVKQAQTVHSSLLGTPAFESVSSVGEKPGSLSAPLYASRSCLPTLLGVLEDPHGGPLSGQPLHTAPLLPLYL